MSVITIECTSAREMVEKLDPSHDQWSNKRWRKDWIFRGQGNADWRLVPSAHRTEAENVSEQMALARDLGKSKAQTVVAYTNRKEIDPVRLSALSVQLYAEITNLREFLDLADSVNLNTSLLIPSEFVVFGSEWLTVYLANLRDSEYMNNHWGIPTIAIAQHHGVATRLLDWTKNPLYAAFFASEGLDDNSTHIVVYALHTFHLRKEIRLVEVSKRYSPYIHAQEGIFTLDTLADAMFLETGVWRSILDYSVGEVYKFTLPKSEVPELLRILWLKRVTKAHIMPSLDNIIPALSIKWKWLRDNPTL